MPSTKLGAECLKNWHTWVCQTMYHPVEDIMKDANKEKLSHLLHLLVWYWSVFVRVVADITLVCPLYLLMTFFALIARQIRVFLEMRKYVSNLLPHLKHSRGTL